MNDMKEEIIKTKQLGEEIGYGNLMMIASALWRHSLGKINSPIIGAFVPRIDKLDEDDKNYDKLVQIVLIPQR